MSFIAMYQQPMLLRRWNGSLSKAAPNSARWLTPAVGRVRNGAHSSTQKRENAKSPPADDEMLEWTA
jgi:hypothetical protein